MMAKVRCIVSGLALLLGACGEGSPSAAEEVAGELRALRMALAQQAQAVGAPPPERVDVSTALAPLRTALDALAASQRELAERQVALAQEMQRWSQLLVESVAGARADEAKTMARRLGELETRLEQQNARHRDVEVLLQGALERTADQLDGFLKRLDTIGPVRRTDGGGGADATPTPGPVTPSSGNASSGNASSGNASSGSGERASGMLGNVPGGMVLDAASKPSLVDGILRHRAPASRWWWLAVTALGLGVATLCLRRSRRSPQPPAERTRPATSTLPLSVGADGLPAAAERSVEEIWAAAALLGEAVGRLRQQAGMAEPGASTPVPVAAAPVPGPVDDEALALLSEPDSEPDAEPENAGMPMTPSPAATTATTVPAAPIPAVVAPPTVDHGPPVPPVPPKPAALPPVDSAWPLETLVAQLPGSVLDREVLAALASERSVLRRPVPVIERRGKAVTVRFHPVPGTTPADQLRLVQRLREALRDRGSSAD